MAPCFPAVWRHQNSYRFPSKNTIFFSMIKTLFVRRVVYKLDIFMKTNVILMLSLVWFWFQGTNKTMFFMWKNINFFFYYGGHLNKDINFYFSIYFIKCYWFLLYLYKFYNFIIFFLNDNFLGKNIKIYHWNTYVLNYFKVFTILEMVFQFQSFGDTPPKSIHTQTHTPLNSLIMGCGLSFTFQIIALIIIFPWL